MPASDYQYWLGKETADLKAVGKRGVVRRDADDKTTGKAVYGRDVNIPGMLSARVLTSPYAHAKIKSMDTSAAAALPGVRAVLRYDDPEVPRRIYNPWDPDIAPLMLFTTVGMPFYILGDEAFFAGQPIGVAIAADDLDIADEALELVKIEWEVLPFVIDVEAALKSDAPIVYEYMKSWDPKVIIPTWNYKFGPAPSEYTDGFSLAPGWTGTPNNVKNVTSFNLPGTDLDKGFAAADQTINFTFNRTEVYGCGPEILSTTARWTDNDTLEAWQAGEGIPPYALYALILGMPESKIFIHSPYAGGQFGGWDLGYGSQSSQIPIAALLSKRTNTPVHLYNRRQDEHFGEMDEGVYNCKAGFKKDGTITAVQVNTTLAQCNDILYVPDNIGTGHLFEDTKIPNLNGVGTCVFLNKHAYGPSRCEQQPDAKMMQNLYSRVAGILGIDEGTVALKNNGSYGHDMQWVSEFKKTNKVPDIDSLSLVIQTGKDAIGWDAKWHAPGTKTLANGKMHGMVMAAQHEFSNGAPPFRSVPFIFFCHISIDAGKIFMTAERPDCGLDGRTGYSRVIAEETGMKLEDVIYARANEEVPSQPQTGLLGGGGSVMFTAQSWLVVATARLLKQKMLDKAATALSAKPEDLDIVDSAVVFKSDLSKATPIEKISSLQGLVAISREVDYEELGIPEEPTDDIFISRCAELVEVEVDPETGGVEITNAVCVNDCQPISPETVEGQMYGGAIMGYSTGTCEEQVYDPATGVILNPNFIDYKIFTILDLPDVTTKIVASRMGYGPYGSCGVGEDNCTFCSATIIPAIYNATGVWVTEYPPTPERVLKALGKG